ncbi:MAG: hypothetical protein ABUS79_21605 [Pseudomonadota bacterium]
MRRAAGIAIALAAVAVLGGGRGDDSALAAPASASVLTVPRVSGPVTIDAELEGKKLWEADVGATGNFKDAAGHGMVPYTEAKARWGAGTLYLMLYAGDLDLEGTVRDRDGTLEGDDAFRLEFGTADDRRVIWVSVLGTVADARCRRAAGGDTCDAGWDSHVKVAVDRDGTLNKIGDNDEEWVVEMAVPLASLGVTHPHVGTQLPFSVRRCEVGHGQRHDCGGWGLAQPAVLTLGR